MEPGNRKSLRHVKNAHTVITSNIGKDHNEQLEVRSPLVDVLQSRFYVVSSS